jgi:hypothetical protein
MKQCPKCSVTYANNKQKFCTKDGTALVDAVDDSAGQGETVRIDSAQLDDEITKVISQALPPMSGSAFDPYKTQVSTPEQTPAPPSEPAPPPASPPPSDPFKTTVTNAQEIAAESATPEVKRETTPPDAAPATPPAATAPPAAAATTPAAATATPAAAATTPAAAATTPAAAATTPAAAATTPTAAATPPPVSPAKKRSKLPLILGILFVLFVLGAGGAVAGYFFVVKPMLDKKRVALLPPPPEPTPIAASTPEAGTPKPEAPKIEVPPYSPPADAVQFVNSNAKLTGKLADHYVDFSFYYPNRWRKDPEAGTATSSNFAKVQSQLAPDAPQEIFAVGWYDSTGAKDTDDLSYPRLVADRSAQFAKTYPEYSKISDGPTKVGPYDAYEFRFKGMYRNTERGDIQIWGRVVFVPPLEGNRGVTLLMMASSLAPDVKSIDDVGTKGELPMMLESFRFGK